jgi:hypothetical protein
MFNTTVGTASRDGSCSDQMMRLRLRNTGSNNTRHVYQMGDHVLDETEEKDIIALLPGCSDSFSVADPNPKIFDRSESDKKFGYGFGSNKAGMKKM